MPRAWSPDKHRARAERPRRRPELHVTTLPTLIATAPRTPPAPPLGPLRRTSRPPPRRTTSFRCTIVSHQLTLRHRFDLLVGIGTQVAWSKEAVCARSGGSACKGRTAVGMRRARSVTGPLRRAHPASGATWNVQVVKGKMSSQCLWHACRALSAGLLLMLLGAAMAVIGYYADTLSVAQEIRGNATVSVKDEARGFHLNNLSYAGPIVMGFGGFIVVAACVMTFEARDSAAKVTPARPQALPRPVPRRGPPCAAPARLDQLGT
ncbi:unnamed protein product [Diatraea saccharalis]|uniref:Uncharacterized protein n=1 Tax=Diatraea saccharalis TaxID=40085 RepID=A0A9N9RCJ8_9NEOP|nr:unnamed protein product [Diatraea saccharalis]